MSSSPADLRPGHTPAKATPAKEKPMKRLYADDILFGDKGQCKLKLGAPLFAATESRFAPKVPADGGNKDAVDAGPSDVLIVAAGGGSSKTGVVNELRVVSFPRVKDRAGAPLGAQVSFSINTGDELVTNLTVSPDGQWLACGSVQHCKLLDLRAGTGTLTERTVHSFQTDFAEPSPGQNVVRFQGSDALFTGGDDGQLRYWSIDSGAEGGGAKGGGAMASVTLAAATQGEEGHRKPIGSIAIHGSAGLVATASKDGTCCVWQFAPAGKRGFRGSIKKAKGKSAKKAFLRKEQTLTLRAKGATDCRACVWSPVDGEHLFVLENCSARRKRQAAYITVYGHGKGGNVDTALEMGVFSLAPRNTQQVGNNPCTAMSICPNGRLLGLGDNGGMLNVFRINGSSLSPCIVVHAHGLPVTGLHFAATGAAGAELPADYGRVANGGGGEGEAKGVEGNEVFAADEGPFADAMYHLVSISADASLYVLPANSFDSSAHMKRILRQIVNVLFFLALIYAICHYSGLLQ